MSCFPFSFHPPLPKCACFTVYFSPPRAGSMDLVDWNPFAEDTFNELTEDAIFGREFDRIKSGSRSSEFISYCIIVYCIQSFIQLYK